MSYANFPWYCLKTKFRAELTAQKTLEYFGIESFLPLVRTLRPTYFSHALFPTYLFGRLSPEIISDSKRLHGISYIVQSGGEPCEVAEEIIQTIREGMIGGFCSPDSLKIGDEVLITCGPFAELRGVFQREISGTERAIILLNTLHRATVQISRRDLRHA